MNKLLTALRTIYTDPSINVIVPIAVTISIFVIVGGLAMVVATILNVLPHAVLLATITAIAIPTALYHIKKNWPKDET